MTNDRNSKIEAVKEILKLHGVKLDDEKTENLKKLRELAAEIIDELRVEYKDDTIKELLEDNDKLENEKADLHNEIIDLQKELQDSRDEIDDLQNEIEEAVEAIETAKDTIEEWEKELNQ